MLMRGVRPPVFRVRDCQGRLLDLWEHLGFKWMLIVFDPDPNYLKRAQPHLHGLAEQDWLVLLVVSPGNSLATERGVKEGICVLVDHDGTLRLRYQAQPGTSYVVEKNGCIKQIWSSPPTPADILERLQAAPLASRAATPAGHTA